MSRRAAVVFGVSNVGHRAAGGRRGVRLSSSTLGFRWTESPGVVAALELASGVGLLAGAGWASRVARAAGVVALGTGLVLVTLLALAASWLSGVYGPVGMGGGIILALVAALALPYLVVLPCVELVCIGPRVASPPRRRRRGREPAGAVMHGRSLARLLAAWALATFVLCGAVRSAFTLEARGAPRAVVASAWKSGALLARAVVARPGERDPRLDAALASVPSSDPDAALRYESVVAEGPVPHSPRCFSRCRSSRGGTASSRPSAIAPST